jgi:carotenoid cleavage dioxygenase
MSATDTTTNPYLIGNFGPVSEEVTAHALDVTGVVPAALDGMLLRNGPNPVGATGPNHHWFLGDGMIHGVRLRGGRAEWYRNRWVRTERLAANSSFTAAPLAPVRDTGGAGAVNVIGHAGRILALGEVGLPWEIDDVLDTVGEYSFGDRLSTNMTAHPKIDPVSGEMVFFGYDFGPTFLRYHVADAAGSLVRSEEIATAGSTMMHDFGVTQSRVVFMDLPVVFDLDVFGDGGEMPFRWSEDHGARLGVMPRDGRSEDVIWVEIDPCYVFHPLNSHDEVGTDGTATGRIVMQVVRYPKMFATSLIGPYEPGLGSLVEWVIDPGEGTVRSTVLDDRPQEFPRVSPLVETLPNRYGYAVQLTGRGFESGGILKHDLRERTVTEFSPGAGRSAGEAVFVPDPEGEAEDDGWLLAPVYDASTDRSDVVVLDARDLTLVATVHLPVRVPFGFHGNWIPSGDGGN